MTIHGLWNAAAIGTVLLSAIAWAHGEENSLWLRLVGLGMLTLVLFLGLLAVTFIFALPFVGRRLADLAEQLQLAGSEEVPALVSSEAPVS